MAWTIPHGLTPACRLIRAAGLLVPDQLRTDWQREWQAELYHVAQCAKPGQLALLLFAWGSFPDALSLSIYGRGRQQLLDRIQKYLESPSFCVWALVALNLLIVVGSSGLARTRDVVGSLPYPEADRIATVSQGSVNLATRSGVPLGWTQLWQQESRLLEDAAAYRWQSESTPQGSLRTAVVSDTFLPLLGARTSSGHAITRMDLCPDCVYLSFQFAQRHSALDSLVLGNRTYRIAGVLPRDFWFLSRDIAAFRVLSPRDHLTKDSNMGTVVRLRREVSPREVEAELGVILQKTHSPGWTLLVGVSMLQPRVRAVFGSFALGLTLAAVVVAAAGLRPHSLFRSAMIRAEMPVGGRYGCKGAVLLLTKTALLLSAVLLSGIEFTHATFITMIGGADYYTEPLSMYLFMIGSLGVLGWSILDQRRRCRTCLRRLGLATNVGCPGCLFLNWAGTELVCVDGHGLLHVPEMVPSWQEEEQWTTLDASWSDLFARR